MKKSIVISGNTYVDNIIKVNNFQIDGNNKITNTSTSLGGVFNFLKVLKLSNHSLFASLPIKYRYLLKDKPKQPNINISKTTTVSTSTIISDIAKSQRTAFTEEGTSRDYVYKNSSFYDYHHISYLDNLPCYTSVVLGEIKKNSGFLSADLCKHDLNNSEINAIKRKLLFIDMLICSTDEIKALFKTKSIRNALVFLKKYVPHYVIHSPRRIYAKDKKCFELRVPYKKNLNVLGAGDIFCSYILFNMSLNMNLKNTIKIAISKTLEKLKS